MPFFIFEHEVGKVALTHHYPLTSTLYIDMGCCCSKPKPVRPAGPIITTLRFSLEGLNYTLTAIVPADSIHGSFKGKRYEITVLEHSVDRGCCGGRCCTCCKCCDKHKTKAENLWTEIDYTGQFLNGKPHGRGVLTETMSTGKVTRFYLEFEKGDPRHCVKTCTDGSGFRGQLHYTDGYRHGAKISSTGDVRVGKFILASDIIMDGKTGKQRLFDVFGVHNIYRLHSGTDDVSQIYDSADDVMSATKGMLVE